MDEVLEGDPLTFIPPVGHEWPALHRTEVDTDRVVGPVLPFRGSPVRQ